MLAHTACFRDRCVQQPVCNACGKNPNVQKHGVWYMIEPGHCLHPRLNGYGDMHQYVCNGCLDDDVIQQIPFKCHCLPAADVERAEDQFVARMELGVGVLESEIYTGEREGEKRAFVISAVTSQNAENMFPGLKQVINHSTFEFFEFTPAECDRNEILNDHKLVFATTLDQDSGEVVLAGIMRVEGASCFRRWRPDLRRSLYHWETTKTRFSKDSAERNHEYVDTVDVVEGFHGFGLATHMLLFAEKLAPYNAAYMTLLTETDNYAMQRAAEKAGYFFLNGPSLTRSDQVLLAKPISPLMFDDDNKKHQPDIDPFDPDSFALSPSKKQRF
jgi:hypothetical protein